MRRYGLALLSAFVVSSATARADSTRISRGAYLATVGDCIACHTAPGGAAFAGGRRLHTPFGDLVSTNITPDPQTGIGGWSDDMFLKAVKKGVGARGQHLYAAMPFANYAKVSDQDILDIKGYLASLRPVHNAVEPNQLRFPFNIRLLSASIWSWFYFDPTPFRADPARGDQWNRGAYLVNGLGHCSACHTPKNRLGADRAGKFLAGAEIEGFYAPALNDAMRTGLGAWSAEEITTYLRTGTSRHAVATGPMAEVIMRSTQFMTPADLQAMAVYLRSVVVPADKEETAPPPDVAAIKAGGTIYAASCQSCHRADGSGVPGLIPALAGHAGVQSANPASAIRVILQGGQAAITDGNGRGTSMPAFAWRLTDAQIAGVIGFIGNSWGNRAPATSPQAVSDMRAALHASDPAPR